MSLQRSIFRAILASGVIELVSARGISEGKSPAGGGKAAPNLARPSQAAPRGKTFSLLQSPPRAQTPPSVQKPAPAQSPVPAAVVAPSSIPQPATAVPTLTLRTFRRTFNLLRRERRLRSSCSRTRRRSANRRRVPTPRHKGKHSVMAVGGGGALDHGRIPGPIFTEIPRQFIPTAQVTRTTASAVPNR